MRLAAGLRYGENPHQPAAAYLDASLAEAGRGGIATAIQHHGKEVRGYPRMCSDGRSRLECGLRAQPVHVLQAGQIPGLRTLSCRVIGQQTPECPSSVQRGVRLP